MLVYMLLTCLIWFLEMNGSCFIAILAPPFAAIFLWPLGYHSNVCRKSQTYALLTNRFLSRASFEMTQKVYPLLSGLED